MQPTALAPRQPSDFRLCSQGKYDQFSYYVSLAMNACKQLKATDSMLYAYACLYEIEHVFDFRLRH
jgi:hypothetical protein